MFRQPRRKLSEPAKRMPVSRDQFASTAVDLGERAESIDLQFEDELIGVEWFNTTGKPDWAQVSREHSWIIPGKGPWLDPPMQGPLYTLRLIRPINQTCWGFMNPKKAECKRNEASTYRH